MPIVARRLLLVGLVALAGKPSVGQEESPPAGETALEAVPLSVWPPVLPPLRVLVKPLGRSQEQEPVTGETPETSVLLHNGRRGDLLGFLGRTRAHDPGWQADADIAAATDVLRPKPAGPSSVATLVERADLALMMGGAWLGLSPAQIYVHYGFLEDGTKPRPSGQGVISPIDPVSCPEGGVSCRQSILKN